jgi:hypothetical protein
LGYTCTTWASRPFRRGRFIDLLLSGVLLCQGASAATYYVATNGSDGNSGTAAAPVQTLQKGVNLAVAGDTVIVEDGTYGHVNAVTGGDGSSNEASPVWLYNSGTSAAWITIKAQHKGAAILDCEMLCDSYINLYNASYIVIQDLVITRGYKEAIHSNDSAHHITLKGNRFEYIANRATTTQIGNTGMYTNPSCHDFVIDGNVFHDIGRTSGSNSLDHGLYLHGWNFTIINNSFYHIPSGWDIQMADGLSNVLVANNTFAFANPAQYGQIMLWNTQTNLTIRNNIFYSPQGYGITRYSSTVNSCAIDHNLVYGASGVITDPTGCTMGTNLVGANPLLVNVSTAPYDFHAQAGGAGIDAGVNQATVPYDFDGTARPQGSSTDMGAYEYASAVTTQPPVVSSVFTSGVQPTSLVVNWSTDQPATSTVQYGLLSYTNSTPTDSTMLTQHSVALSGLLPSTLYHFHAGSTNSTGSTTWSSDATVTTASMPVGISLSAAAAAISVVQGQAVTDGITATLNSGSPVSVSFSASSLPAGVSATFSSPNCTATCSTTLTLSASATAAAGVFNILVSGAGTGASASTTIALTVSAPLTPSGLAALWDFSELTGTTTADKSGNGNTGTLHNASWASNVCSGCVWLGGSGSYVSVNESTSLEASGQITVSMWLNPARNKNVDPRIVSKLYSWEVKLNNNRTPQFSVGGIYAQLKYSISLNTWQHIVFTFSSGVVKGYVNGVPVTMSANTFTSGTMLPLQTYGLFLGTDPSVSSTYAGYMDDVRIYNRALTDSDVATLYSTTLH